MKAQQMSKPQFPLMPVSIGIIRFSLAMVSMILFLAISGEAQTLALGSRFAVSPNIGNKEGIAPINQDVWTEIKFLDSKGNHSPAPANINVIITATVLSDLNTAKKTAQWQTAGSLDKSRIILPKSKDAIVVQGRFPSGWKSVWVGLKSERGGTIKVFIEGEQVITGSSIVNVGGPAKLAIAVTPTSIPLSSYAQVDISLRDFGDTEISADADYNLSVTATALGSLNQATRVTESQQSLRAFSYPRSLEGQLLVLPRNQTAVKLSGLMLKGKRKISLRFKSEVAGAVRLYVQGDGLFPAGMPVAVIAGYSMMRRDDSTKEMAAIQLPPTLIPALWQAGESATPPNQTAFPLKLKIEGYNVNEEVKDTFRFKVFLYDQNDQPVNAPEDIAITLKLSDATGKVELSPVSLLIPRGKSLNEKPVEVKSSCDKELVVVAETQADRVSSIGEKLRFNPPKRATMLDVQTAPSRQVASGWNSINLRVSALNDCGEPVRAEEENLGAGRPIAFTFERALRLDGDNDTLIIPAGSFSEAKKVFSSDSGDFKITATDQSNRQVSWMGDISFYFPWIEFISAIVGGLLWPLISALPKLLWKTIAQGALSGAIGFGLALFGAIVTEQAKLGDLTINLLRLPMTSWLPAGIMGFIGYLLIAGAISVPHLVKKNIHKSDEREPNGDKSD